MTTRRSFLAAAATGAGAMALPGAVRADVPPGGAQGKVPLLRLNNGVPMPALGFGTYNIKQGAAEAVNTALGAGYRLVDTAAFYGNEEQVGQGIARSGIPRRELFVTTKLWIADYGYDEALRAFDVSLGKLGLDTVDLYLLHYPTPSNFEGTLAAYRAMERLLAEGRVKAIGVSNFQPDHLQRLIERSKVVPAVNQVELHPYMSQRAVREANARHGVLTEAWSPLGGIFANHPKDPKAVVRVLDDPRIGEVARRVGKSPAQVVLRWHLQSGVAAVVKSVHPERIAENIDVFRFELSREDMAALDAFDAGLRGGGDPETFDMNLIRARARK
ncbi:MAG TPA: aldo/keto reductase [Methylobacterium sp.]|jgi:diketogulonate reductase-like aldo/keto reductase|nr:aldo/keto reductase [Methylobacterium sp.]